MPSPVGGLGLAPRKKIKFALKKYAILSKFWYFFPILQQKVGDYPHRRGSRKKNIWGHAP